MRFQRDCAPLDVIVAVAAVMMTTVILAYLLV